MASIDRNAPIIVYEHFDAQIERHPLCYGELSFTLILISIGVCALIVFAVKRQERLYKNLYHRWINRNKRETD